MSAACPLQTRVGRWADRSWACAREQPSAARAGGHRFPLRQVAPTAHVSCRAVADENMAMNFEDLQNAQLHNGKVLGHQQGVALVEGLSDCAPVGALVLFSNGAKGTLLWWHSVGLCTVLMSEYDEAGEDTMQSATAQCVLKEDPMELPDALKDPDAASTDEAPALSALFTRLSVPAGSVGPGQLVDHLCRPLGAQRDAAADSNAHTRVSEDEKTPLLNEQVGMEGRGVISEPLFTGIPALDVLTPLAHGCALLAAGTDPVATTDLLLRIASHLSERPVATTTSSEGIASENKNSSSMPLRIVYVAAGCSQAEIDERVDRLRTSGALEHCTVVAAPDTVPVAQQYAALCAGIAIGESVRDAGGKAVVLLDSAECMVEVWKAAVSLALGGASQEDAGDMVEVNGMLVSAAAAERRCFLSALVQRAAKRLSGGTLTLLIALSGIPASGERTAATRGRAPPPLEQYKHLRADLKAKMAKALAAKAAAEEASAPMIGSVAHLATETVEEMMSITDGQLVLKGVQPAGQDSSSSSIGQSTGARTGGRTLQLDVLTSLSRMGTRAYPLALKDLAPKVRFELTQAVDAQRYSTTATDAVQQSCMARCRLLEAALQSPHDRQLTIGETASLVWLLLHGHLDSLPSEQLWDVWPKVWSSIEESAAEAVSEMATTQQLTEASKAQIQRICKSVLQPSD